MTIRLRNAPAKVIALVIALAAFALAVIWIGRVYLAGVIAQRTTVVNLKTSLRLDPGNSRDALMLGRLYQYSVSDARPKLALKELTRATTLNPYNAQAWLDLATGLEFQGNTQQAALCLRRVDYLAPQIPADQWAVGNFFLLHGSVDEAFPHFKRALAGNPDYWQAVYNLAWKASNDPAKILQEVVPGDAGSELTYLNYLISTQRLADTGPVWNEISANPEKFPAGMAAPYIDALVGAHKPDQAYSVWSELRVKGLIPPTYEARPRNLIENGDFEDEPVNMGFDWRIAPVGGVYVGRDSTVFHSATHSLLIQFPGTQNFDYHNVFQYVLVLPNRSYHLSGFMRTDKITTDSGPSLEVRDAYNVAVLDQYSKAFTGTTDGWRPVDVYFKTGPKTDLISVSVARRPSDMFESNISGRVWVDDVRLDQEPGPAENSEP
jgi:hypothetical protein